MSYMFNDPISSITYNDQYNFYLHENIIENLNDERCDTLKRGILKSGILE